MSSLKNWVNLSNVSAVPCERRVTSGPYAGRTCLEAALVMLANFPLGGSKKDAVDAAADAFDQLTPQGGWATDTASLEQLKAAFGGSSKTDA